MDSTLWEEDPAVRVTFLTMLAIKDFDHVVRMPMRRLVRKVNLPLEQVQESLRVLMEPDSKSLDHQKDEGRRLREVEGGWLVINGQYYQDEMVRLMTRLRKSQWQREARQREKEAPEVERKKKAIRTGKGSLAERLAVQAEKDGDAETLGRLAQMEAGRPGATEREFVEKFHQNVAKADEEQRKESLMPGPVVVVAEPPVPEGDEADSGERFPEV